MCRGIGQMAAGVVFPLRRAPILLYYIPLSSDFLRSKIQIFLFYFPSARVFFLFSVAGVRKVARPISSIHSQYISLLFSMEFRTKESRSDCCLFWLFNWAATRTSISLSELGRSLAGHCIREKRLQKWEKCRVLALNFLTQVTITWKQSGVVN